jgi:hypothetical protein
MREESKAKDILEGNEGQEFAKKNLVQVQVDDANWRVLHRNPKTGEYWEESFPESELHGGGPPVFKKISEEEAKRKFDMS